jgi:hypothetical protein
MDAAPVPGDHELPVTPLRIFVSADEEFEGELFEHGVVEDLEFVFIERAEDGAGFSDVLNKKFVGEL